MASLSSSSSNVSSHIISSYEALHQTLQTLWTTHFSSLSSPIAALSITILALILTTTFFIRFRNKPQSQFKSSQSQSKSSQSQSQPSITKTKPLKNVFDVKQRPFAHTSAKNNNQTTDRPFGSSYYYAHNNPNATGGYRDGLRAEDYVMNGPRLLSRNGISVPRSLVQDDDDGNNNDVDNDDENGTPERTTSNDNNTPRTNSTKFIHNSQPITRYLWDDDHDTTTTTTNNNNNIAKIYIDSLPGNTSTSPSIQWQTTGITKEDVSATLVGDDRRGLLVQIRRRQRRTLGIGEKENNNKEEEEQRYHLHVPRMYGEVESVRVIVKSKRLIVKLVKKGGGSGENGTRDNGGGMVDSMLSSLFRMGGSSSSTTTTMTEKVKSWPQLASRETKGTAYDWSDYIDEDVFRNAGGDGDNGVFL